VYEKDQNTSDEEYNKFKYCSQIDFIRSLKNAKDKESIRKLALAKEPYFINNKNSNKH